MTEQRPNGHPSPADITQRFWRHIDAGEWEGMAALLDKRLRVGYVHTGETFDREAFIELNREYPGRWRAEVLDLVTSGTRAVAQVRMSDASGDGVSAEYYVASFATIDDGLITELVEVWADGGQATPQENRVASAP